VSSLKVSEPLSKWELLLVSARDCSQWTTRSVHLWPPQLNVGKKKSPTHKLGQ
jgi:hypothetical protein